MPLNVVQIVLAEGTGLFPKASRKALQRVLRTARYTSDSISTSTIARTRRFHHAVFLAMPPLLRVARWLAGSLLRRCAMLPIVPSTIMWGILGMIMYSTPVAEFGAFLYVICIMFVRRRSQHGMLLPRIVKAHEEVQSLRCMCIHTHIRMCQSHEAQES